MNRWTSSFVAVAVVAAVWAGAPAGGESASVASPPNSATGTRPPDVQPAPPGATYYAVVHRFGKLDRGVGVVSSDRAECGGCYEVIFERGVRRCAYVASIGGVRHVGITRSGEISTMGRYEDRRGVFVTVRNSRGELMARPFHLVVQC